MSLIGTLEQFSLSTVLQRVERHEKTGWLVLKNQDSQWIEFYLHEGRLLCVGPLRTNASLGERLLQDGVISGVMLREALLVLDNEKPTESLIARTLMELNYVGREELRAWAIQKAVDVLNVVLAWSTGEVHFEENKLPPADRLLVSMSISSLLASSLPVDRTVSSASTALGEPVQATPPPVSQPLTPYYNEQRDIPPATPSPDVSNMPTLMGAMQFGDEASFSASSLLDPSFTSAGSALPTTDPFSPLLPDDQLAASVGSFFDAEVEADVAPFPSFFADGDVALPVGDAVSATPSPAPLQAVPVMQPEPPKRIDVSFMQPHMLLMPADLSAYRDQNQQVQLTPEQWQILIHIDGQNSLQALCQILQAPSEYVCTIAGELIAEGLVYISIPGSQQIEDVSPAARELAASGLAGGYVAPGYTSATASPWSVSMPAVSSPPIVPQSFMPAFSAPTEAQWGNGGNGAAFIPGQGWIISSQSLPNSFQASSPQSHFYAPAGVGY